MITINESFCLGKLNDETRNEDGLFMNQDIVAVVDGATSFGDKQWEGLKPGAFIRKVILDTLPTIDPTLNAKPFLEQLNRSIASHYDEPSFYEHNPEHRLTAGIVIYNDVHKEIWRYGDCPFLINGQLFALDKKVDTLFSDLRVFLLQHAIMSGGAYDSFLTDDFASKFIEPLIDKQMLFQNKDCEFGYPAMDGTQLVDSFIEIHKVPQQANVVLASDGYPVLESTLQTSEDKLSQILAQDPLCIHLYKSTKGIKNNQLSFDDRTYIRFTT